MSITSIWIAAALGFLLGAAVSASVIGYLANRADKIAKRARDDTATTILSALSSLQEKPAKKRAKAKG